MTTEILVVAAGVLALLLFLILVVIAVLFFQLRKIRSEKNEVAQISPQLAVVNEKLSHIEPVTQTMSVLQADMRGLGERIGSVESNQTIVYQGVNFLGNEVRGLGERIATVETNQGLVNRGVGSLAADALSAMSELKSITTGLNAATGSMRDELARAKNDLTELHAHVKSGQESDRRVAESVRRLEAVIAGTQTKGSAGENVLEAVFSRLPAEWQVRDFRINGKFVEFALRLPNNLLLPIDSKWAATNLLEQFVHSEDIQEQQRLKKAIEDAVLSKAKEVEKYIDPAVTVNFGVAVIPDAVYDLCTGIQSDTFKLNVVLISYSMFIPYLLLVFQTHLKSSRNIDLQKFDAYLQTAQKSIEALQTELDGRFSRAITMINNSRDEMRTVLGHLGSGLTGLQMGIPAVDSLPEPVEDEQGEIG